MRRIPAILAGLTPGLSGGGKPVRDRRAAGRGAPNRPLNRVARHPRQHISSRPRTGWRNHPNRRMGVWKAGGGVAEGRKAVAPSGCSGPLARLAKRQRSTSPRMKASTLFRAVVSSYCSGGDFMK